MELADSQVRALRADLAAAFQELGAVACAVPEPLRVAIREACVLAVCQEAIRPPLASHASRLARLRECIANALAELDAAARLSDSAHDPRERAAAMLRRAAARLDPLRRA